MKPRAGAHPVRPLGFTLVEVLVVMALLSVVMLALGSAMSTVAKTEARIDERIGRGDELRTAVAFLRSTLGRISGRKVTRPPPAPSGVMFGGGRDAVTWVGVMPARYGVGGRHFFRLAVEPGQQEPALVIRFVPWVDSPAFPEWSAAQALVLVKGVTGVSMHYMDSQQDAVWVSEWTASERLPDRYLLEIQTAAGPWPPLNVALRLLPTSDRAFGGAVFGPE
jgi:general secretion pathway protein J